MSWSSLTLCTDADLGAMEPAVTSGDWGETTWPNQRAEAKRDLRIWLENDYAQIPGVVDRVRDTYRPDAVLGYTSSAFTDYTGEAGDDSEDDVPLADIFATFGSDRLYIGSAGEFDGVSVRMLETVNAAASVLTAKFWTGGGWTALTTSDGTSSSGKTFAKSGRITWTMPTTWERRHLNDSSEAYFWVEVSVSAALTANTAAGQILPIKAPDGLKRVCAFRALGYIAKNLAAQAPSTDYWLHKARNQFKNGYWDEADALYATMRDKGSIPIDYNLDGVIDPETELNIPNPIRIGRA